MSELKGYEVFSDHWQANARLALDTIAMKPTKGIPTWILNDMQWTHLDLFFRQFAGKLRKGSGPGLP